MPPVSADQILQLYFDDSGSRNPDRDARRAPRDKRNAFALGGIIVAKEEVETFLNMVGEFRRRWEIQYPLHSQAIRTEKKDFAWLGTQAERRERFLKELSALIATVPFIALACVIHRPGYMDRYDALYGGEPWRMCKTAFAILAERAAKYADRQGKCLEIYFERAGKREDRDLIAYLKQLKAEGMPFSGPDASKYAALQPNDFRRIILGDARGLTKASVMLQIADLVLYPIVRGRYEPDYRPYQELSENKKILDALLPPEEVADQGVKYSCFDGIPNAT